MIGKNLVAGSLLLLPVVAFAQESKPFSVGLASFSTSVWITRSNMSMAWMMMKSRRSVGRPFWHGCGER